MRTLILIILCGFTLCSSHLFAQEWQWGRQVRAIAGHTAVDKYHNIFAAWPLNGTYEIGGEEFTSYPSFGERPDAAFSSFDCDGNYRWTRVISGPRSESMATFGQTLGVDTLGGVYFYFDVNKSYIANDSIYIDIDTVLVSPDKINVLLKYDTDGNYQWLKILEDNPDNTKTYVIHIEVTPNGDCYLYSRLAPGTYGGGVFEVPEQDEGELSNNLYILKYDKDGNFISGTHLDLHYGFAFLQNTSFVRDPNTGGYYVAGRLGQEASIEVGNEIIEGPYFKGYVISFDENGNYKWHVTTNESDQGYTAPIVGMPAIDEDGNIYVTGGSFNTGGIGDFTFSSPYSGGLPILIKIDPDGNVVYATNGYSNGANTGKAVNYSNNHIAVAGDYAGGMWWGDLTEEIEDNTNQSFNTFLVTWDADDLESPNSLNVLYSSQLSAERVNTLISDDAGNLYVSGNFGGTLYVGDDVLYNQTGPSEGYIAKFGTDECYCPPPIAQFEYDSIPNQSDFIFTYTGTEEIDSIMWNFGDGNVSYDFNPQHQFAQAGDYNVCVIAYNSCGSDTACVSISAQNPVGIHTIKEFENIKIYPNPVRDVLRITGAPTGTRVEIFNAVGQKVMTIPKNKEEINVTPLANGIYVLRFIHPNGAVGYERIVRD